MSYLTYFQVHIILVDSLCYGDVNVIENLIKSFKRFYLRRSLKALEQTAMEHHAWFANLEVILTAIKLLQLNTELVNLNDRQIVNSYLINIAFKDYISLKEWLTLTSTGLGRIATGESRVLPGEVDELPKQDIEYRTLLSLMMDGDHMVSLEVFLDLINSHISTMIHHRNKMPKAYVGYTDLRCGAGIQSVWEIVEVLLRIATDGN